METSIEPINQIPVWAQWLGIWSSFSALALGVLFQAIGKLISYRRPCVGFIIHIFFSALLVAFSLLAIWLASIHASKGEGAIIIYLSIVGTLCFVSGLIGFLSLSTRLIRKLLLSVIRYLGPVGRCKTHKRKLRQSFDSLDLLLQRNAKSAWLLPPPSSDVVSDIDHGVDYLELEIREWSWLVTGTKGRNGLLEDTHYLFITWNLEKPQEWSESLIEKLSPMLVKLGEKASSGKLLVHRVMIGSWLKMTDDEWKDFETKIWNKYIGCYCPKGNKNYKVRFLDTDVLKREFSSKKDKKILEMFLDVSFFSFDSDLSNYLRDNVNVVLPFPEDFKKINFQEYAALQYSEHFDGFLALQAVQGTAAKRRGTKYGDKAIKERRIVVRQVIERASRLKNINSDIQDNICPSLDFEAF